MTFSSVVHARPIPVASDPAPRTGEKLLQFTSQGHVLGFSDDGVYVASARHMLKVDFLDSNSVDPQTDGNTESEKVQPLSRVTYENAWDGVTVVYEASGSAVAKSTYYLDKDNHVERIRLGYNRPIQIDEEGNLVISFENGTLTESAPIAWQEIDGKRRPVKTEYVMNGEREIGFSLGDYVAGIPVVIDPDLSWNTFLGASGADVLNAIASDGSGNVYVVGQSVGTWGSPLRAFGAVSDAFVAKLDSSGVLVWSTFLGGNQFDAGSGLVLDGSGNVYVSGHSFSTWGTPLRAFTSAGDAFAAKLTSSGALIWNTFLGGSGADFGTALVLDSSENIYVGGYSTATWGTPLRAYTSGNDAFAAKLNSSGVFVWNTFLGGSGEDRTLAIMTDGGGGDVYVSGYSFAAWGSPVRPYTALDAFVVKLNSSGALVWSTFLGGSAGEFGNAIAVDGGGNVYIGGSSDATWGTPVRAYTASSDGFVAKLDSSGVLVWNTFLGASGGDSVRAMGADINGNLYIGGSSGSSWGTPIRAYTTSDGFAAKLNTNGVLIWNTFLGGSGVTDVVNALAVDAGGNVYVGGNSSGTWGTPVRAYTPTATDGWAGKISNVAPVTSAVSFTGTVNVGQTLTGSSTYSDADGDPQGTSTFRWLRNGSPIIGATSTTYTLVSADGGTTIAFEVTPVAAFGLSPGTAVSSAGQIINSAPVASAVNITGTPNPGRVLTGSYTYSDADGDPQGTPTFRWLRNGSPIIGATSSTYTMTLEDLGTTSTFEVIPVALTGTSPGVAVSSSGILIVPAPIATSHPIISVRMVPSPIALPNGPGSVTYAYTLSNNGQITMTDVTLVDDSCANTSYVSGDINNNQWMETSETWIYTCTTTLDRTTVNYATARGVANSIATVDTAVGQVVVGLSVVPPLINIVKTPNPLTLPAGGGSVTYTYSVTNPGSAPLSAVSVSDNTCNNVMRVSGDTNNNDKLEASETWTYVCTIRVTESTSNTALVTGEANGFIASDTAIVTVVVEGSPIPPLIHILKKADHVILPASGGLVTFTYTVMNPGTVPLENVTVTDDKCSPVRVVSGDANGNDVMETFETWTFSCQQTLLATTTNTANARGQANGLTVTDTSVVSVVLLQSYILPTGVTRQLIKLACLNNDLNDPCRTVYYVDINGKRHAFPNDKVYFTWYSNFEGIQIVSPSLLASIPLGSNITYKPGVRMVKFATDPKVYAVSKGGILRWVVSETVATALYGGLWNLMIDDVADAFHNNYGFGADIDSSADYSPALTQASASYPGDSLRE